MVLFCDLVIDLGEREIDSFINSLIFSKTKWSRDMDRENKNPNDKYFHYCFKYKGDELLPDAYLFLANKERRVWYVSNIVPTETGSLPKETYNKLLENFKNNIVDPVTRSSRIKVAITKSNPTIEEAIGNDSVASALKTFSSGANMSTGSSHPLDQKRWFHFIVVSFEAGQIDSGILTQCLIDLGWLESNAHELVAEYEFSISLLRYYNRGES